MLNRPPNLSIRVHLLYTIYRVVNTINGKFYVGKHQTDNPEDDYLGSGKLITRAIEKYGRSAFVKEILEVYSTEREMNLAEKILVVLDKEVSYNLCPGGRGGWGYLNDGSESHKKRVAKAAAKSNSSEKSSKANKAARKKHGHIGGPPPDWTGRKHSPETKAKMSANHNPRSHPVGVKRGPYKKRSRQNDHQARVDDPPHRGDAPGL